MGSRTLVTIAQMDGFSRVYAIGTRFCHQRCVREFSDGKLHGQILWQPRVCYGRGTEQQKDEEKIELSKVVYDNEQAFDVIRRLPLAPDYKTMLSVLGMYGGGR